MWLADPVASFSQHAATTQTQLFTELPLSEIEELSKLEGADINKAKVILADEATKMLHGEECLAQIHATVANLFTGAAGSSSTAGACSRLGSCS